MKRLMVLMMAILGLSQVSALTQGLVTLTYYGQSCFLLRSPGGADILMDPFNSQVGFPVPFVKANAVTVSHEHFDHNYTAAAQGNPIIIRGLKNNDWAKINQTVGDVQIRSVGVYHDDRNGAQRGKNAVMIFKTAGISIVHLGDLGHVLTPEQVKAIGRVDVLLVPVGGVYTIDAAGATKVVAQLNPKIVVPMHYKTGPSKIPLATVDAFLKGKSNVQRIKGPKLEIKTLPAQTTIMVLEPK